MNRKKETFQFICDCEAQTVFDAPLPDVHVAVLWDVECIGCQSIWTVRFRKLISGKVAFTFRLKEPSRKLHELAMKKKADEIANRPQKKAPTFYLPASPLPAPLGLALPFPKKN